jgi:small subunit ribosomal protein S6
LIEQLTGIIAATGGNVDKAEKWGIRKLAYRVQKRQEGYYVLLRFTAGPTAAKEIERRLRVSDLVMKFITVRIDEKLKRIEKRKKQREKRAARKPAPPLAAPGPVSGSTPAPGTPAMPGTPSMEQVMASAAEEETQE